MDRAESGQRRGVTSRRGMDELVAMALGLFAAWAWAEDVSRWLWVYLAVAWAMELIFTLRRIEEQGKEEAS